ncbi:transglutaminase domain-containing protein [Paenibacillus mucilaginosus 3016]|uniref:Transglutaminase domain-containing protein n=3 Tax=Paenibacillus mucilaginosus TaxID=61624 RepID=H6NHJ8_9BACL|nr:transglutaminase domain-containing protein [Paenibacillus mucilaginosus 3016]
MTMNYSCETDAQEAYLEESEWVDYSHPMIRKLSDELYSASGDETAFVQSAFEFVRDHVSHSWDIQSSRITRYASEVLKYREGICYAKSNLLCALARSQGVPAGFCYQRLTLGDTPDTGYVIHALNAVYLRSMGRWIRLDARGNKPGVDARFSLEEERLAFPVRAAYDEWNDPVIYKAPHPKTTRALLGHSDCMAMYLHGLPSEL